MSGPTDVEVQEGALLVAIEAGSCPTVEMDDVAVPVSWHRRAQLAIWNADLTNQVGFHRLRVKVNGQSFTYDIRTRTAKATWDEVEAMAETCASAYLGYKRQFTYMAANGTTRKVRLPQVHYAWLRDRLPEVEQLVRSIDARPATKTENNRAISLRSKGLSVPHTSRLLRERHQFLELSDNGPIEDGRLNYWPSRVVVKTKKRHSHLDEHVQIATFLQRLALEAQDLFTVAAPTVKAEVQCFVDLLTRLRAAPVFQGIFVRLGAKPTTLLPSTIERADRRYGRLRDLQAEYGSDISDSSDYARSIRANIKDVWEIYQTYVAHVVGNALGLTYSSRDKDLRKRSADGWSMASPSWQLYFDTKPPKAKLMSWRDSTARPADERPDIVLLRLDTGEALLLDAKFKLDAFSSQRATQADLFEMQGYLNSFGVKRGGIIFPGPSASANVLSAKGNSLLELPIRADHFASLGGTTAVHEYVRTAVSAGPP
jgi:hypothetical protein